MESVITINFNQPESKLADFKAEIKDYVDKTPPATIKQACSEIETITGIKVGETQMRVFLKSIGISRRKVAGIPAKANIKEQENFLKNELEPRLQDAIEGKRKVYFGDAAHFVLGAFSGYLWSMKRVFLRTPSGRQRFNVLGALDAVTKELVTVTNDTYITSIQVCDLLKLLVQKSTGPITVVLDNARYQRCAKVMDLAKELGIELVFLPSYSPNLNLIERVWKFTKAHCLNSKYYAKFTEFRDTIDSFLTNMYHKYAAELKTLLSLKFQVFTETQYTTAL